MQVFPYNSTQDLVNGRNINISVSTYIPKDDDIEKSYAYSLYNETGGFHIDDVWNDINFTQTALAHIYGEEVGIYNAILATGYKTITLDAPITREYFYDPEKMESKADTDKDGLYDYEEINLTESYPDGSYLVDYDNGVILPTIEDCVNLYTENNKFVVRDTVIVTPDIEDFDEVFYVKRGWETFKNSSYYDSINKLKVLPIFSDPTSADGDFDSLLDYEENQIGTNALTADTDGDELSDKFEIELWFDPLNKNPDVDYLNDFEEYKNGTSPYQYDKNEIDYIEEFCEGFIAGDFNQDSTSIPFLAGQITSSTIPVVGTVGDVRDVAANLWHGDIALAGLSALGIVPLVGDATKTVAKVGKVIVKTLMIFHLWLV